MTYKLYSVDRCQTVQALMTFELQKPVSSKYVCEDMYENQEIMALFNDFFHQGLSRHGLLYLNEYSVIQKSELPASWMIESTFELVRRLEYPHRPSRMQSMFAWLSFADAAQFWLENGGKTDHKIYQLELDESQFFVADQRFLTLGVSMIAGYELARKYWSGQRSKRPKLEAVVPLPVQIGHRVSFRVDR